MALHCHHVFLIVSIVFLIVSIVFLIVFFVFLIVFLIVFFVSMLAVATVDQAQDPATKVRLGKILESQPIIE